MARVQNKLTDARCKSIDKPGVHGDGEGLYLRVKPSGSRSWVYVWKRDGKRREMGLGSYPTIGLAKARTLVSQHRLDVAEGRDPIQDRRKEQEPSFGECADLFLGSMEVRWRNHKHRAQWRMTLENYAARLQKKRVSEVDTDDVLAVLKPIWDTKPETASRLRGRIERVLDYAKARGWRIGENPAIWRGHMKNLLPPPRKLTRGHHSAMPHRQVPSFITSLRQQNGVSARALEFLILTASRSGEVREMSWSEVDMPALIWTIPAERMKSHRLHRLPLTPRCIAILQEMDRLRSSDYVFPGQKKGRPMSVMAFTMTMRRSGADDYTVHGFRSAFRDWVGDETGFPREVAEAALAHTIGDTTERAYRRSDAIERRRRLMDAWEDHCSMEIA
ncbi:MAG: integrase arm-type DNA-binding domain-containing protein [Hyphomicrobiales bacterium]|nr:integrase arm-type DNA-binding domain-containing protein [Hyphomicrobiales bacterium]